MLWESVSTIDAELLAIELSMIGGQSNCSYIKTLKYLLLNVCYPRISPRRDYQGHT